MMRIHTRTYTHIHALTHVHIDTLHVQEEVLPVRLSTASMMRRVKQEDRRQLRASVSRCAVLGAKHSLPIESACSAVPAQIFINQATAQSVAHQITAQIVVHQITAHSVVD